MFINVKYNSSAIHTSNYFHDFTHDKDAEKTHFCFNSIKETLVYGKNINTPKQVFYFQVVNIDSNQMKSIIKMYFISSLYGFL